MQQVKRGSIEFLYLLLGVDLLFILLNLLHVYTPYFRDPSYSIETDRGFAEIFQYVQEYWLILLFGWLAFSGAPGYLTWALLFGYIVIDDAFTIHERLGVVVANLFSYHPLLLRARDFGELTVLGAIGGIFLILLSATYYWGSAMFKQVCKTLLLLMCALVFFGVVVDMLHILTGKASVLTPIFALLEDGGEMVVMSVLCWYVYNLLQAVHARTLDAPTLEVS